MNRPPFPVVRSGVVALLFAWAAILPCAVLAQSAPDQGQAPSERPLTIVAAENFYGDVARQLAGSHATVTSILSNPDQDPHLFETSPSAARAISGARIVILNGADYDPWMEKLLGAAKSPDRKLVVAADVTKRKPGANPHLWYDPATMPAVARVISQRLIAVDPANKPEYEQRLRDFLDRSKAIDEKVAELKHKYAGLYVTATEPVFGYMAAALGMEMHNERFQTAVMNGSEPSAGDVAIFENDLRRRRPKLFIYNGQASNPAATRLMQLARQNRIPVLGVTETAPENKSYQDWILEELDALDQALSPTNP